MVGLDHGGVASAEERSPAEQARHARLGLILFSIYCALYGVFVALAAFDLPVLAISALAGVNLALIYGFGLIVAALGLALLYGWLCRKVSQARSEERS
jgi:uncharacterized membrane protein (DUF485 family)